MKSVFSFLILALSSYAAIAQSTPGTSPVGVEAMYFAKDDGTGNAGGEAKSFVTTDIPIYCVVQLDSATPVTVKMNLVAESVPGVKAETRVVTSSYTIRDGEDRVNFSGRPKGRWIAGKYRADIFVDGKLVKNLVFEIKAAAGTSASGSNFQPRIKPKPRPRGN
jgi:hypothetical protein